MGGMSTPHENLLGGPRPTLLPEDPATRLLAAGDDVVTVAAAHPASSAAWATLAEQSLESGRPVEGYAYARTGYHRGLDALRRSGWGGFGPVPWEHASNQGVLRAIAALGRAADAIDEQPEAERCRELLRECDPAAVAALPAW
jgi:hypothetical protein